MIIKEIDFNIDINRAKNRYGLVRELDDNDEKPDFEIEKWHTTLRQYVANVENSRH